MAIKKKDAELYKKYSPKLAQILKLPNNDKFYDHYFSKIMIGGEIKDLNDESFEEWTEKRLKPNLIFLDIDDYNECAIGALETYKDIAATDHGTSKQRDEIQLWSDKIRGYLAEKAFQKKILRDLKINSKLAHEQGNLEKYKYSDIPLVKNESEEAFRENKLKISIKMAKWNGVWLDVGGAQPEHSDIYVQVKVNTGREHLMSFLKHKNSFERVLESNSKPLSDEKKKNILSKINDFENISLFSYVAGFRTMKDLEFRCECKKARTRLTILSAEGLLTKDELKKLAIKYDLRDKNNEIDTTKISFPGIGEFSSLPKFVSNTGKLKYKKEDWAKIGEKI
jgi:hypothetical protein